MKKYILMPFGYEYNDNTYDPDGFEFSKTKYFTTIKEANDARLKMTKERCSELNERFGNVLDCIDYHTRYEIVTEILDFEDRIDFKIDFNSMTKKQESEVLKLLAPFVYDILEVESDSEYETIRSNDDYYNFEYDVKFNENNEVVMHSLEKAAYRRNDPDFPNVDSESFNKYYIEGEELSKDEWDINKRDLKIGQVIE